MHLRVLALICALLVLPRPLRANTFTYTGTPFTTVREIVNGRSSVEDLAALEAPLSGQQVVECFTAWNSSGSGTSSIAEAQTLGATPSVPEAFGLALLSAAFFGAVLSLPLASKERCE